MSLVFRIYSLVLLFLNKLESDVLAWNSNFVAFKKNENFEIGRRNTPNIRINTSITPPNTPIRSNKLNTLRLWIVPSG